jgi:hypothetical protein
MVKQTSNITCVFWLQGSALLIYLDSNSHFETILRCFSDLEIR